ncbi:MAG: hypothetical protein ACM3PW_07130 [Chlamydiota bacterium]
MRKTLLLFATVALFALCTWAQQQNTPPANAPQTAVRGCLTGALHQYRLVDDNHLVYRVVGSDKQLDAFAGQQVEITGKLEERIPPKEKQTASSFSRPEHRLTVANITKISDTCTGASE